MVDETDENKDEMVSEIHNPYSVDSCNVFDNRKTWLINQIPRLCARNCNTKKILKI